MRILLLSLILAASAIGCKKEPVATAAAPAETTVVILQLNWKPEPQFGGFYAGNALKIYEKHGLKIDVREGGAGAPTIPMLAAKQVDFAVVSADEIVTARSKGQDIVALFAVYQTCPQGLMTRKSRGFKEIGDIFKVEGTVAMESGLTYAELMKQKYGFDKVKIVPSPFGDLSVYLSDPNYTMQCFVTSEPLAVKKQNGPEAQTFLLADAGYNPYTTVLACHGSTLREKRELTDKVVAGVKESWEAYLADASKTNEMMGELNPTLDAATFADSAEVQKSLIQTDETKTAGLGVMNDARWQTLIDQMVEFKAIDAPVKSEACYELVLNTPAQ